MRRSVAGLAVTVMLLAVSVVPAAAASSSVRTQTLVGRWSFERPLVTTGISRQFPPGSAFGGWTVAHETVSLGTQKGDPRFPASQGNQFLSLADATLTPYPGSAGTVCRSVAVVRGHAYRVKFDAAATMTGNSERFIVKLGGVTVSAAVPVTHSEPWTYYPVSRDIAGAAINSTFCLTAVQVDPHKSPPPWPIIDNVRLYDLGPQ